MTAEERIASRLRIVRKIAHRDDIANRIVDRTPCARCNVRADLHANHGCRIYRRSRT